MRFLSILVLFSFCLWSQPQPERSPSKGESTASRKNTPQRSEPPSINQRSSENGGTGAQDHKAENKDNEQRIATFTEKLANYTQTLANYTLALVIVTAVLVAVGLLQFSALVRQTGVLRHHSELIDKSIEQMKNAVAAYESYVGVGEQALALTRESNAITRDATEITRQSLVLSHRPRVTVHNVILHGGVSSLRERAHPKGQFYIVNEGGTRAGITEIFVTAKVYPFLPMKPMYLEAAANPASHFLAPGESMPLPFQKDDGIMTEEEERMLNQRNAQGTAMQGSFYVFGFIKYTDDLQPPITRQTFFCRTLDHTDTSKGFKPVDNPDYERAD